MTYRAATDSGMGFALPVVDVCAKPSNRIPAHSTTQEQLGYAGRLPESSWRL